MKLTIERPWRYARGKMKHPGSYRVPQDISQELAERALREGFAEAKIEATFKVPSKEHVTEPEKQKRIYRKRGAPENKALASNDKTPVD